MSYSDTTPALDYYLIKTGVYFYNIYNILGGFNWINRGILTETSVNKSGKYLFLFDTIKLKDKYHIYISFISGTVTYSPYILMYNSDTDYVMAGGYGLSTTNILSKDYRYFSIGVYRTATGTVKLVKPQIIISLISIY